MNLDKHNISEKGRLISDRRLVLMKFVRSVFRLPFLLHVDYYLEFYFGKRLTILFLVLGLVP